MMDSKSRLIFPDGSNATIARYSQKDYSIYIQTNDENKVGSQQVIVRNCDAMNRLLELNLYINVLSNTHPDFVDTVQTSFTMAVNETFTYQLPVVEDPNANDVPVVYVAKMEAQEDRYPPFLMFENSTNTIIFRPIDRWSAGQTFYFIIVVKEQNSDTVKFVYYCTLTMQGVIEVRDTTINYTDIDYSINWIGDQS